MVVVVPNLVDVMDGQINGAQANAQLTSPTSHCVFLPIGFDAFGLPAENAAIRGGFHPREWTMLNIENMRRRFRSMGLYESR